MARPAIARTRSAHIDRNDPLNDRQRRFVQEYLVDLQPTEAAIRAGYQGRTRDILASNARSLLSNPLVQEAVKKAMAERAARTRISADRVLKEYARIAFADMRSFASWDAKGVTMKSDRLVSEDDAAAVAEVSGGKRGRTRIRLHDKKRALDAIAKHLGLFDTRHAGDPMKRMEEASRAREILAARIEELAARK